MRSGTGPAAVITDLGCYGFENGEMILRTIHSKSGIAIEKIKEETGWELKISHNLIDTLPPTAEELRVLHEKVDPTQRWSGGKHA